MITMASNDVSLQQQRKKSWQTLEGLAKVQQNIDMRELFSLDPTRAQTMSLTEQAFFLDYSKNTLTPKVLEALNELCEASQLSLAIKNLLTGQSVNTSEQRAAWHTALRQAVSGKKNELPSSILQDIEAGFDLMEQWVDKIQAGYVGATGKIIKDVIHIGIGGSDLGPRLLVDALKSYHQSGVNIHFVANIDPEEIEEYLERCCPETTLIVLASKSFSTQETLVNGALAKTWLGTKIKHDIDKHFLAITSNSAKAIAWGVPSTNILPLWDWVGGRYSIWSSIALPAAIKIGMTNFKEFLRGGYEMDEHFSQAPFLRNMPVLMALVGIWHHNFLNYPTQAILPYSYRLKHFPDYLQQLDMESNGKQVQVNGESVSWTTGPVVWGQAGTNGQHAFYQLIHQGTHIVPTDFILIAESGSKSRAQHQLLLAHGVAQTKALKVGLQDKETYKSIPGNKPSTCLVMESLTPKTLGMLIALYEHKVYVQGVVWQINSFDQPGVELGKTLANEIFEGLNSETVLETCASTRSIMDKIKSYQTY